MFYTRRSGGVWGLYFFHKLVDSEEAAWQKVMAAGNRNLQVIMAAKCPSALPGHLPAFTVLSFDMMVLLPACSARAGVAKI